MFAAGEYLWNSEKARSIYAQAADINCISGTSSSVYRKLGA